MLSIGKLGQGQGDYYIDSVASGIEDYYTGAGEAPGRWTSTSAQRLGLHGEVDPAHLRALLDGDHPLAEGPLVVARRGPGPRVPGFDLTFSAPKSVSLAFGLGDAEVSREMRDAHEAAVDAALGYLERHAAVGRRGRGGAQSVLGEGFVAAAFRHRTSRAGDPQLHTHVFVANAVKGPDGRWTALDGSRLYAQAKTAGYLYQAQLRGELTRRLGVQWTPVRRGQAEIDGIPPKVLRAFSRRRAELEERMTQRGDQGAKAAQIAARDTRQAKTYAVPAHALHDEWRERAATLGFATSRFAELTERNEAHPLDRVAAAGMQAELLGPHGLTERRSTFGRREALQAWAERLREGADVEVVERLADDLLADPGAVALARDVDALTTSDVIRRSDGTVVPRTAEERRHSTTELLARERDILHAAEHGASAGRGVVAAGTVDAALGSRPSLSDEQATMVRTLLTDGAAISVVVGKAGTGKTFALDAARDGWRRDGFNVTGVALARRAARELEDGAGIPSSSVAALLNELREIGSSAVLGQGQSVLVVDEAGMVGTRQLHRLITAAQDARAKVVLVGDHHQLPEIDAGGAFRALVQRGQAIELSVNRRQRHPWEREALDLLREGRPGEALARYDEHDRIVVGDDAPAVRSQLVADWWQARHAGEEAVMIALRRDDVSDLNAGARSHMTAAGRLGPDALTVDGRAIAVGDEIVCLKNDRRLGVLNGTRGSVTSVDPDQRQLTLQTRDGERLLPADYLDGQTVRGGPALDHGYAITGHKAQGMTTGHTFVLGSDSLYREWGYVAMSRGRDANRLYLVAADPRERDEYVPTQPRPSERDAVTTALARSRAQPLAHDAATAAHIAAMPTHELRKLAEPPTATPRRSRAAEVVDRQIAEVKRTMSDTREGRTAIEQPGEPISPEVRRARAEEEQASERLARLEAARDRARAGPSHEQASGSIDLVHVRAELARREELAVRRRPRRPASAPRERSRRPPRTARRSADVGPGRRDDRALPLPPRRVRHATRARTRARGATRARRVAPGAARPRSVAGRARSEPSRAAERDLGRELG